MGKNNKLTLFFQILILCVLLIYSFIFFSKVIKRDYIFTGDTMCTFAMYSYQYSGFARGEYPLWNPLVRSGEPEEIQQALFTAHPISNIVAAISVLIKGKDVVLSYAVFIFLLILLYVIGNYLLVSLWTANPYAGVFALILSLGTSSVFWAPYHHSFVLILHSIPWILYSATKYFRKFKFKYLLMLTLASASLLYSYEFMIGASYLIMLSIAAIFFYHKRLAGNLLRLLKIPVWHVFFFASILIIMAFPDLLIYLRLKGNLLPISRITDISVTDKYTLQYSNALFRGPSAAYSGFRSFGYFLTLFLGIFKLSFEELRLYVGPLVLLFAPIGFFPFTNLKNNIKRIVFDRRAWCIMLSVFFVYMFSRGIFPANLLYKLPGFSLLRNTSFLLQICLFAIVIIASFGFDNLLKNGSRKIFNATAIGLLLFSLIILFLGGVFSAHNVVALSLSIFTAVIAIFLINFTPHRFIPVTFLTFTSIVVLLSSLLFYQLPMSGWKNDNPAISITRNRIDHSLHFLFNRPADIEMTAPLDPSTNFGKDEFSSYLTLKDNSYKTSGGKFGHSSFPLLKSYYLFMSLPGHEEIMKSKFFFFNNCYTSLDPADMIAFRRDPKLFEAMLVRRIGLVNRIDNSSISLGPFKPESVKDLPAKADANAFSVKVVEYKANSVFIIVSVNKPGLLAYIDLWDDGWKVKLDGRIVTLKKVLHTFKGVELSPGVHEIRFYYRSKTLNSILLMNFIFISCILILILYPLLRRLLRR